MPLSPRRTQLVFDTALALMVLLGAVACSGRDTSGALDGPDPLHHTPPPLPKPELGLPPDPMNAAAPKAEVYPVPPPKLDDDYWPCTACHNDPPDQVNTQRRKLVDDHTDIVLHHGPPGKLWCLDCHDAYHRDKLRLANGTLISFKHSEQLCGQCHGTKYRDWKLGIHGKRTGMWNGQKEYLLCVHCHNPHSPHFKPLKPKPPPLRPEDER